MCISSDDSDDSACSIDNDSSCGIANKGEISIGNFWGIRSVLKVGSVVGMFARNDFNLLSSLSFLELSTRSRVERFPGFYKNCFKVEILEFRADERIREEIGFVCPKKIIIVGLRIEKDGSKTPIQFRFESYCGYADKFYSFDLPYISRDYWIVN